MALESKRLQAEVRLSTPDRPMMKKIGDFLLKGIIILAKLITDFSVKIRAFIHDTQIHNPKHEADSSQPQTIGYRSKKPLK